MKLAVRVHCRIKTKGTFGNFFVAMTLECEDLFLRIRGTRYISISDNGGNQNERLSSMETAQSPSLGKECTVMMKCKPGKINIQISLVESS